MNQILHSVGLVSKAGIVKTSGKAIHNFLEKNVPGFNQSTPLVVNSNQLHTTQKLDKCGEDPCKKKISVNNPCKKKNPCKPKKQDPCAKPDPCKKPDPCIAKKKKKKKPDPCKKKCF